jgi:hypothetical protein
VRGDDVKAVENLGRAFEINPALRHDTIGLNLAMDLTGLGSNAAVATLADPASRYELMQRMMGVEIAAGRRTAVAEATWGGAFIDLGIYGLVNGAIVFVVSLVAAELLFRVLMVGVRNAPSSSANLALLADLNTQQITLPLAGLYGLLAGVGAVVMLLVIDSAIHIVATTVLGGQGTLAGLVRKTTLYYTVLTGVSLLLNIGFAALAVNVDRNTASALSYLPLLVSLALALWAGKLTGDAYDFGTAKGCVSMMLGYFVLMATLFCCSVALGMALASSVQALP